MLIDVPILSGWGESEHFTFDILEPIAKEYVKEKYRLQGKNPDEIAEEDIKKTVWYMKMVWIVSKYYGLVCEWKMNLVMHEWTNMQTSEKMKKQSDICMNEQTYMNEHGSM